MNELPDLDTITTMLAVVEGRDPTGTTTTRFDDDHSVLLDTQAEIVAALTSDLPAGYDKDSLRNLLDRIENDIDRNRSMRRAAASAAGE